MDVWHAVTDAAEFDVMSQEVQVLRVRGWNCGLRRQVRIVHLTRLQKRARASRWRFRVAGEGRRSSSIEMDWERVVEVRDEMEIVLGGRRSVMRSNSSSTHVSRDTGRELLLYRILCVVSSCNCKCGLRSRILFALGERPRRVLVCSA